MNLNEFSAIIVQHRQSLIIAGIVALAFCILGMVFVRVFTRKHGVVRFSLGKIKFPPELLLLIPIIANIVYYSVQISNCNKDISQASYETYIGDCTYNGDAVILEDLDLNIYVGKYNSIVPKGTNYGKCIYSKHAKVIVYWEAM